MNALSLSMAFAMGLAGSLHCAGMCGPIVWVMPFNFMKGVHKWLGIFSYHVARISVYALLAVVLHSFRSFFNPQIQQIISIVLGTGLLFMGLLSFMPTSKIKFKLPWAEYIKKQLGKFIGNPSIGSLFITGALNGLLPCGLVYMALAASVTSTGIANAAGLMYAFGLGTMPMLIGLTIIKNRMVFLKLNHVKKLVPLTMFVMGSLFVVRGMNLGIPYLSPKLEITQTEVKACCCHKK
ncbi:MAG: sulfite exporter TauE/SafE family protein [Bacteroidetes bacterium]|nr:sulfite exporter TauE/SafE family protein [Bacteroidota bacterium]